MNFHYIRRAEETVRRISLKLASIGIKPETQNDLDNAEALLSEVRHFKVCCDDLAKREVDGLVDGIDANNEMQQYINRLITFITQEN